MAFIDYNKAFDSIKHSALWSALLEQGVHKQYITIIRNIYLNSTAKIQLEQAGEEFKIKRGVKQGDPLSPKLFSAVLEKVFRNLDWEHIGLNINGKRLNHLRFADDIILLTDDCVSLQTMVQQLTEESEKVGLQMNTLKTKLMTNQQKDSVVVNGNTLEYVDEYIYLGQIISTEQQTSKEIERRICNSWKSYWALKEVMKNKEVPTTHKSKIFNTCILPCLSYGCQTWGLTQKDTKRLEVCQHNMERSMLSIKKRDKIRLNTIRDKTKVWDITKTTRKLKWKWVGHMMREERGKWTKDITEWYPREGKRQRGRQYMRWEDDIKATAGAVWRREARDRKKWKNLEEAFVIGRTE